MKNKLIISLVLITIGAGFYIGYQNSYSRRKHTIDLLSPNTKQVIHIEYQLENPQKIDNYGRNTIDQTQTTFTFNGTMNLGVLIESIAQQDPNLGWKNYPNISGRNYALDIPKDIRERKYNIRLTYPKQESTESLLQVLGKKLDFKVLVSKTTLHMYRAIRNNRPIVFSIITSEDKPVESFSKNTCSFFNVPLNDIFSHYNPFMIIEDAAGINDRFEGEIVLSNSIISISKELQTKAGVDLIPIEKTMALYKIR